MTPRLQEYLDAIQGLHFRTGRCTIRDIGAAAGVTSSSTVDDALNRLVVLGKVKRVSRGTVHYYEPAETHEGNLLDELRRLDADSALPESLTPFRDLWEVAS